MLNTGLRSYLTRYDLGRGEARPVERKVRQLELGGGVPALAHVFLGGSDTLNPPREEGRK